MNRAVALIMALALVGCGHTLPAPPVVTVHQDAAVAIPVLRPMSLQGVQWRVYDLAGLKALVAHLEANPDAVVYVLDQTNYGALAMNLAELKRFITDQKAANDYLAAAIQTNAH